MSLPQVSVVVAQDSVAVRAGCHGHVTSPRFAHCSLGFGRLDAVLLVGRGSR